MSFFIGLKSSLARSAGNVMRSLFLGSVLLSLAACGEKGTEDVQVRVDGSHLVIENRSGTSVHIQPLAMRTAWVPLSTDKNRLDNGKTLRIRIAPSERGKSLEVAWWRPGEKMKNSEIRGADRVRYLPVTLTELQPPYPQSEDFVRTCIELESASAQEKLKRPGVAWANEEGHRFQPDKAEQTCMKQADNICSTNCSNDIADMKRRLGNVQAKLQKYGDAASERKVAATAVKFDVVTPEAFLALQKGRIDEYLSYLCPSLREQYGGAFMRGKLAETGRGFATRGIQLGKVLEKGTDYIVYTAADEAALTGRAAVPTLLKVKGTFQREGDAYCLSDVALAP